VLGLLGTVGGAHVRLAGALDRADRVGLAAALVGATLVAPGTSLPELVTVIQSTRRREADLVVGNLLGSNLFNALAVGGATGLLGPGTLNAPELSGFASIAAVVLGVVVAVMMLSGRKISRREGVVLVLAYAGLVPALA
jgi:cation:H+ antiporter